MDEAKDGVLDLAARTSKRLAEIEGVEAVALGGSWARGEAHPDSDVDLGIYYRSENPPNIEELRRMARELDDRGSEATLTGFGGWGPWINGGGWLTIEGRNVDWLYRDLDLVKRTIHECRSGRPEAHYQPGHPHGFHTHIYLGEIHYSRPLQDQHGTLGSLKHLADPYPPLLKEALVHNQLWEARFALDTCRKTATRGDVLHVTGSLFRCAACLTQTLFALNERYVINEKGSVETAASLPMSPPGFGEVVDSVLAGLGERPDQLQSGVQRFESLLEAVEDLRKD